MRVLMIRNPRRTGGADRHAESWAAILAAAGIETDELWFEGRPSVRSLIMGSIDLLRGRIVPEALLIDDRALRADIERRAPDAVVFQTARVYRPHVAAGRRTVLDFVDQLSLSYRQRASTTHGIRRAGFRLLAWTHGRFERRAKRLDMPLVAVGAACAKTLGAVWMPVTIRPIEAATSSFRSREFDAVFFGKLDYPPNVEALEFLSRCDTSGLEILVTGRAPTKRVAALCEANGWTLEPDFESPTDLANRARVAVAPLTSAVGIQNKVLEAAAARVAQLVTPASLGGIGEDFPVVIVETPEVFGHRLRAMIADPQGTQDLADKAERFVADRFEPDSWVSTALGLVGVAQRPGGQPTEGLRVSSTEPRAPHGAQVE